MRHDSSSIVLSLLFGLVACTPVVEARGLQDVPVSEADLATPTAEVDFGQYPGAPFEDRSGNLWFSAPFVGLIRFDGRDYVTYTTKDGLPSVVIRDIIEDDDGLLWLGTTNGVATYDGETFATLTNDQEAPAIDRFSPKGNPRDIWDLHLDREGKLWIATMDGVFRYDGKTFHPFPMPAMAAEGRFEFTPKMVYCIFEGRDGSLWFGTDGAGAVRYDGKDMTVYTAQGHGLCSDRVAEILEDSRGHIWFGTSDGGVSRYDGKTFSTHLRSKTFSEHTGWGRFMGMLEDKGGNLWFGVSSQGGGVHRFDGEAFRYFSQEDGLGSGGVPSISEDRSGRLWLGTTSGVYRLEGSRFVKFSSGS